MARIEQMRCSPADGKRTLHEVAQASSLRVFWIATGTVAPLSFTDDDIDGVLLESFQLSKLRYR